MNDDVFPPPDESVKPNAVYTVAYERGISTGVTAALLGAFVGAAIARRLLKR